MDFRVTHDYIVIPRETIAEISARYHRIVRAVNRKFWSSESDRDHCLYVGSYGRGTAIVTSDIDMLVEIPVEQRYRFSSYSGNGQSQFLQAVKDAITKAYPKSEITADGQVVKVDFREGMKFEVLPAFSVDRRGKAVYEYPDTNMGGHWKTTNPKAEQQKIGIQDRLSNGLLRETCRQIRALRAKAYPGRRVSGIMVDSFVYLAIGGWKFQSEYARNLNWRLYWQALLGCYNSITSHGSHHPDLQAPGSEMKVDKPEGWDVLGKILSRMAWEGL